MILNTLSISEDLQRVFVEDNRYLQILNGFLNTLKITGGALILGVILGVLIAAVRTSYDKNKESLKLKKSAGSLRHSR